MKSPLISVIAAFIGSGLISACGTSDGPSTPNQSTPPVVVLPDPEVIPEIDPLAPRGRYSLNNQCFAIVSNSTGNYLAADGDGYNANAVDVVDAEPFFFKPARLGEYLLYNSSRQVLTSAAPAIPNPAAPPLSNVASNAATVDAIWTLTGVGDTTNYPPAPLTDVEPTPQQVIDYRGFLEPNVQTLFFTLTATESGEVLAVDGDGAATLAAAAGVAEEQFRFEPLTSESCAQFPEASSNFVGTPFSGTQSVDQNGDGRNDVAGMVDAHVHISSTNFLGKTQWGFPYDPLGVEHALADCTEFHGQQGELDTVGALFSGDTDGHDVTGWPTFPEWPARNFLTHEAIYWKWLERSWAAGLRIAVNDLVDNETLCELQRSTRGEPTLDCNSMNNAGRQAGSMYAMQDYIDAQYGGRGEGFFQIVLSPEEARDVIEDGKLAIVLGIEISNFLNCKIAYNPARQLEPFEETNNPIGPNGEPAAAPNEVSHFCSITETGAENEVLTQLQRIHDWGVRQVISIHEFDNALGGNGIFDGEVLNLGNRENSGGIPSGTLDNPFGGVELPTGEFWTTYDCPPADDPRLGGGYLFGSSGGTSMTNVGPPPPFCQFVGQGGRPGGSAACYPAANQCNARWMTPTGVYAYSKMMEMGFIFDWDHMEFEMKYQALEIAEAQNPPYPFVSIRIHPRKLRRHVT